MNARRTGTILVVEDHADSLSALAVLLTREGYTVHVAAGVREAESVASSAGCDLLLADLGLPDGRGTELMRELKLSRGARGIAISGFTDETTKREAAAAGFEKFIEKPAVFDRLLAAVRDVMSTPPACSGRDLPAHPAVPAPSPTAP
jgi:two-component system KDP operon response regulator KdpE